MFIHVYRKALFTLLIFILETHPTTYGKNFYQKLEKISSKRVKSKNIVFANKIVNKKKLQRLTVTRYHLNKAKKLYQIAQAKQLTHNLTREDFLDIVIFISYLKNHWKRKINNLHLFDNIYIHPANEILKLPIQIFDHNHIYINFKGIDPQSKKGGFKEFTRSIDFESEKIYASLISQLKREKDYYIVSKELEILTSLQSNPYILGVRDAGLFSTQFNNSLFNNFSYQMDLYDSDLTYFYKNIYSTKEMTGIFLQAAMGLEELHQNRYIHRDIKPNNFLLKFYNNQYKVVLADFGLSQHISKDAFGKSLSGTRGYIDPELCSSYLQKKWACKTFKECSNADLYSLGMSFFSLLTSRKNEMKRLTYDINSLAFNRNKNAINYEKFNNLISNLEKSYQLGFEEGNNLIFDSNDHMINLYVLAWQMINPSSQSRPSLNSVIQTLTSMQHKISA